MNPPRPSVDQTVMAADLLRSVEDADEVLVLTHDNPDPDAIAAAAGLGFLLERAAGVTTTLAFGGIVGRAENRALIEELGVDFRRIETVEIPASTLVALVDTQPRTGNNSLPEGRIASVVVDHHPLRPETSASSFVDVRPDYGASCSMLVEYLRAVKLEPDRRLATALFYGIQSETMDLGREVSAADVSASIYLYPRSDPGSISRIRHARVPASYLGSLHEAIQEARRYDGIVRVSMGRLAYPDMVAEVADLFMRVEGTDWTLATGRYQGELLLSLRTYDPDGNAGRIVRNAIGDRGTAGGHGTLAGGQVPVKGMGEAEVEELTGEIFARILEELGVDASEAEPVIEASTSGEAGTEPDGSGPRAP
jgi:nanoRNase/pAp phosphatase (c-di-AMP/oligoRNAs hydrolase)